MQSLGPIIIINQLEIIIFVVFFFCVELNLIFKPSMTVFNLNFVKYMFQNFVMSIILSRIYSIRSIFSTFVEFFKIID
jgi:hypothetical protein